MLKHLIIPVSAFHQNCTLLWCDQTLEAMLVDPGGHPEKIKQAIADNQVNLTKIILTHGHLDHVGAAKKLAEEFNVPIYGPHEAEKFWFDALPMQSKQFGLPNCGAFYPDQWLTESDTISLAGEVFQVIHCPGHTPGHVVYYHAASKLALVGDVLFYGSIGRTDFPLGDHKKLIDSIKLKLFPLGDDVVFIPGHGPQSTFGRERLENPYLQ